VVGKLNNELHSINSKTNIHSKVEKVTLHHTKSHHIYTYSYLTMSFETLAPVARRSHQYYLYVNMINVNYGNVKHDKLCAVYQE